MVVLSPWVEPFFEGAATASTVPSEFPVAIAGHAYMIEPKLYRRSFVPIRRDPRDDSTEPGEQSLTPEGLWRRSQSGWSLGAGQEWLDEEESSRQRFYASLGMDVLTEDRQACLLPRTEEKRSSGNTNLKILRVGPRFYVVDGDTLIFSNGSGSEQNATWVTGWTTATGLAAGTILDIAFSGDNVYVLASDNSIYRATIGTTAFTLWYNPTAVLTRIWAGLGRLFGSDGRTLYEINATPGEATILQHPDPGFVWSDLVAAPTGVYAAGNISEKGEIRYSRVEDDGTGFIVPVVAAEFLNEKVHALAAVGSNLVIGTSLGWRFSPIDGQVTGLSFGPVVSDVGAVRALTVDTVGAQTFVWFTWENIETGISGLGRIRPARFTEPNVPAYASDIYSSAGGTPIAVASLGGRRYFAISSDGFFGPTSGLELVSSGTLQIGKVRYGILDAKVFTDFEWHTDALAGSITVTAEFDTGSVRDVGGQTDAGTVSGGPFTLGPTPAEWIEATFTLARSAGDATEGPCLRWWLNRAIPAPKTTERILVPLILKNKVRRHNGAAALVHPHEEVDFLRALIWSQQIVSYQEGASSESVYVSNLEVQPTDWNVKDSHLESITLVELYTV